MVIYLEHFSWPQYMDLGPSLLHVVTFLVPKIFEAKLLSQNSLALGVFLKRQVTFEGLKEPTCGVLSCSACRFGVQVAETITVGLCSLCATYYH